MKEKKINLTVLIIIILVVLIIGIGIGYLLFDKVLSVPKSSKDETQGLITSLDNKKIYENNVSSSSSTSSNNVVTENIVNSESNSNSSSDSINSPKQLKYDVEKFIYVNGKSCKVSCNNTLIEKNSEMNRYKTTLYFNDEELKTLETTNIESSGVSSIWDRENEIALSLIKDYEDGKLEYIVISVNSDTLSGDSKNFLIIDKKGKILGELDWTGAYGIGVCGKNKEENIFLETYGFKASEIIKYSPIFAQTENGKEGLEKEIYTIRDGKMQKETQVATEVIGVQEAGK